MLAGATPILVHNTSASLGANLRAIGEHPTTPNPEAHHLVPENHKLATAARGILKNHGIDIDSAENGVWLGHDTHRGTFPHDYVRWINDEIVNANSAGGKSAVLDVLSSTKQTLQDLDLNFGNGI
ncbi:AHH domain-containing protein [Streptomyces sp. NPDC097610]|uniref:AHH domain-containing protein n=1 Tax=Streptomyces sp. NPDC097610 TaxID=3157227 RepID=UPI00332803E5